MGQYFVITIFLYFKDIKYFGLTTEQSSATFGVNCDVPNLHFPDTCVTDDDCIDFPNTVCSNVPINQGLDPGTRNIPFDEWEPRDTLLKSCFCRAGHLRIPQSKGCYDPIRKVVTLRYLVNMNNNNYYPVLLNFTNFLKGCLLCPLSLQRLA